MRVANVYEGIDLIFYTSGDDLEYDFLIAPGADPRQIQMVFEGTKEIRVDPKSGDLVVKLPGGSELRQLKPKVYQQAGDKRVGIAGSYKLLDAQRVAFTVAGYDRSQALVIDPRLTIARSISGIKDTQANAIAVDDNGNTFITGSTLALNLPVTNNSQFETPHSCGSFPFDPGFCGSDLESECIRRRGELRWKHCIRHLRRCGLRERDRSGFFRRLRHWRGYSARWGYRRWFPLPQQRRRPLRPETVSDRPGYLLHHRGRAGRGFRRR